MRSQRTARAARYYFGGLTPPPRIKRPSYAVAVVVGVSAMWLSDWIFDFIARRLKPKVDE